MIVWSQKYFSVIEICHVLILTMNRFNTLKTGIVQSICFNAVFKSVSHISCCFQEINKSQEDTKVYRAARFVALLLCEASVPSDLRESVQYCMHCFTLVCVTYHEDCPKKIQSSVSLIGFFLLRPLMNLS